MATSSKFDITSCSPDRPLYVGGQRGSHIAAQLDRSSSFRENMDNPISSSLPNTSRSTSSSAQGDLKSFFHCMRFDPKVVAAEHKSLRQGDFKRHVYSALGLATDESPSGSTKGKMTQSPAAEEVKRIKVVLRESSVKARERVKIFNEALSVFNKFFPTVPTKKRSRLEGFPGDRSGSVLSSDRSSLGPNMGKIGVQSHSLASSFEIEQQKSEERTKASLPNKRTRTSFVDAKMEGRNNALMRQSGTVDRDREVARLANSGAVQGEDRNLSTGVDGWEKSKMKKKRSVIKPEVSPSTMPSKPNDGYREAKQGMQHRAASDSRSRLNNDSHGFRPGVTGSIVGAGKSDGMLPQNSSGMRSSTPRTDSDSSPVMNEKRDRPIASEKERVNLRAVNKVSARDESNSVSPVSNPKARPSVRGPRSGTGSLPKSSPATHRSPVSNDWEINACTNKPPSGVNNRKRMTSARSSSPPVAHWAGQRPQKISRTARRSNLVPIITNTEENSPSDVTSNDNVGFGFGKRILSNSPKMKGEPLSESEESGAADIKSSREKLKKCDDVDEKGQKMSNLVISSRKNKLSSGEDLGDGVRRQGRTGRGFASTRSLIPMSVDKTSPVGSAKQLRSARHGIEKSESKAGRPPSRKLSDRKACTRQKQTGISGASEFLVGSDNVHDELLAAANAAANPACSSQFWKQMDPLFSFISDSDITCLKQQGNIDSTTPTPLPALSSRFGLSDGELMNDETLQEDPDEIPLCQRLLAALISEEDYNSASEDLKGDIYGSEFDSSFDEEFGMNSLDNQSLLNFPFSGHYGYNGLTVLGKSEKYQPPETDMNSNFRTMNGLPSDQAFMPTKGVSEFEYANMPINEKLLLEMQSIGIFPEPLTSVPGMAQLGDEEISDEIRKLEAQYQEQTAKKKSLLDGILKVAEATKENQEKEFEQRCLEKLVTMAYEKYTACWGSSSGGKGSNNKMAKQSAFAFVKRTLDHVHKYEETSTSCFSEPLFRDIFHSRIQANGARQAESATDGESSKCYASIRYLEGNISASMVRQLSASPFGQNVDNNDVSPETLISEQATGKEDMWSDRVKKRELSLDDVAGYSINTANAPSSIGGSLTSSAKGKRSERDRDGKIHNREVTSRNGTAKLGRPSLTNTKGERKNKLKPKQKTQLSVSVNGLLGKMSVDQHKPVFNSVSKSNELTNSGNSKEKDEFGLDGLEDPESMDLSHLPIPGMDVLGAPDDLDGQSQDLGTWLNIDDEGLQDHDFMGGLEIPMDDLADLNMMV